MDLKLDPAVYNSLRWFQKHLGGKLDPKTGKTIAELNKESFERRPRS